MGKITGDVQRLTEVQVAAKQLGVSPSALLPQDQGGQAGARTLDDVINLQAKLIAVRSMGAALATGGPVNIDPNTGMPISPAGLRLSTHNLSSLLNFLPRVK